MLIYWLIVTHPQWHKDIQAEAKIKKKGVTQLWHIKSERSG